MSGHSHWATIKRKKAANDAKKGQNASKLMNAVYVALRAGANPDNNLALKSAIDKARAGGVSQDSVDRALIKASEQKTLEEVIYEVYGPSGIAMLMRAYTDNNNRTFNEIKHMVSQYGKMAEPGTAKWLFEEKGVIAIPHSSFDEGWVDELISLGLEDYREEEGSNETGREMVLITDPKQFFEIKKFLEERGVKISFDELQFIPKNSIEISNADRAQLEKQVERFLEHPDISQIFNNTSS